MRHILIAILFATLVIGSAHAAQTTLTQGDVLRGQFTETRQMKGFNGAMISDGHFTVAPGYGLIWDTQKPFAITTIITPNGLTQNIDGAKVTDMPTKKIPFLLHLYGALGGALAGDWQALDKDFTVARTETSDQWQIILKPRQADNIAMPFDSITVKGSQFAENVHMEKSDGDSDDITFHDQAVSHSAPDAAELSLLKPASP